MNEYILAGLILFGLIALTVVLYFAIYELTDGKKNKAKRKARTKAYHNDRRKHFEREAKERFDLYLLTLGVR